jgi:hypothetical protein
MGELMYTSTLKVSGQLLAPAALPPGKDSPQVSIEQEVWRNPDLSGRYGEVKFLDYRDSNSESSVVQLAASRYTDCQRNTETASNKYWNEK